MQTIHEAINLLHGALCDYIEATYHIGNKSLINQRKKLLNQPGVIHQTPYLESTPRYLAGKKFSNMVGLPTAVLEAFHSLSNKRDDLPQLIYDPPFQHQWEAIDICLVQRKNLIIMTGTGSGKTEAFLLPILGKLAQEAKQSPDSFANQPAMRALILYPMNALVNDQLGRLRTLFSDPRLVELFKHWSGRPPRFARYTSRTPYAGIRTPSKDSVKLKAFQEFYCEIESSARNTKSEDHTEALELMKVLIERGKWPAKPNLSEWLGDKGSRWKGKKSGMFSRAITLPMDSELLTRHEVQIAPADLLVTNYSMLEYMLMRPIERTIFDKSKNFYFHNPNEKFLVVLDEAHLYRGAAGAEVGLLLRRLRDRLDISPEQFQVICATASFKDHDYAPEFCAQLSGLAADSFVPISGTLQEHKNCNIGSELDAEKLAMIDLSRFYNADTVTERFDSIRPFLEYRNVKCDLPLESALYHALDEFDPMGRLVNETMKQAVSVDDLGHLLFPTVSLSKANTAVSVLLALGSVARLDPKSPGLLPCRIHKFFRGLAGLWVCMDPNCSEISDTERNGICGKMYSQPREICECGARVHELYTCRNCGTAYARTYTNNLESPTTLWSEPGQNIRTTDVPTIEMLSPLDLLLESPRLDEIAEPADYDLETGCLNPSSLGPRNRQIYINNKRLDYSVEENGELPKGFEKRGQFIPCAVCGKTASYGRSYIQDHQTKGDEPFQTLVMRQIQIQPPNPDPPTPFAPLQGRKVLTFSDSRQVAARLAPNLQTYSTRDSLRPLIAWGYRQLQEVPILLQELNLEDLYLASLLGSCEFNVRLRPEMKSGESFTIRNTVEEAVQNGLTKENLPHICFAVRNERPPEALLNNLVKTVQDRFLGFEALALASIREKAKHTPQIEKLANIPGIIETPDAKIALARAWLRCWKNYGFWLNSMPLNWWRRPRAEGTNVRSHKGRFKDMDQILLDKKSRKIFLSEWLPHLLILFTEDVDGNHKRLRGSELTLSFEESNWIHCSTCKSVHRPIPDMFHCLDCGSHKVKEINPNSDTVFLSRKGFYRKPVMEALKSPPRKPMALIAAEHTAQLNAPQIEDVFSVAEENELLFQDIKLGKRSKQNTSIDVLSSTTTMEVGIDIGTLSGVALRNMPPSRANYQQRSGRAGRRGNSVATVVAFGGADSHDEHYFTKPNEMIRGEVIDPQLTLDNKEIVRRHIRAFLLQKYHQSRLPELDPDQRNDLFSVLGTVGEFRSNTSILNRDDLKVWLSENKDHLTKRVSTWIPNELSKPDRNSLLSKIAEDCLKAVDEAIAPSEADIESEDISLSEQISQVGESHPGQAYKPNKLLDRLLYCGKLPRYAFPTNVATFHVFDKEKSTDFRPIMRFAPQQSLPVALTQFAPSKQVWISGKCYTSGAIYSVNSGERFAAWEAKRIYMECSKCGFAETSTSKFTRHEIRDCEVCGAKESFGPGRYWITPSGFAHPVDVPEVTTPDDIPETSYATRAKLSMGTPNEKAGWITINERLRVYPSRQYLLVSNTGPSKEGYTYCNKCGRIEASVSQSNILNEPHSKPFPSHDRNQICYNTTPTRSLVLGTDYITDIALFSLRVTSPISLNPGYTPTNIALRTVSEALAIAACRLLEIEPGEIMAEYRPALTPGGRFGTEAEIFLYDTLPGGAGFSSQLSHKGNDLFTLALEIMETCPEQCETSCYRCLRSFKNKFEHALLDRHVGTGLIKFLLTGTSPEFNNERLSKSTKRLFNDLQRQSPEGVNFYLDTPLTIDSVNINAPILSEDASGRKTIIALSGPLTPKNPSDPIINDFNFNNSPYKLIIRNELLVRSNLSLASRSLLDTLQNGI